MNSVDLLPDIETANRFISAITGEIDPVVCVQVFDDTSEKRVSMARHQTARFSTLLPRLIQTNAQRAGVFLTINKTDGHGRKEPNITAVRALFIDCDGSRELPTTWPIPPSVIVQRDATHWHAYWSLLPGETLEQFTTAQDQLAAYWGTDAGISDLPRVMRIPGFVHHKAEPVAVRLVCADADRKYSISQVLQAHPVYAPERAIYRPALSEGSSLAGHRPKDGEVLPDFLDTREATRALDAISPDIDYPVWIEVGQALHCQFSGGGDGLALWDSWSSRGSKYAGTEDVSRHYQSFRSSGVTFRTVLKKALAAGYAMPKRRPAATHLRTAVAGDSSDNMPGATEMAFASSLAGTSLRNSLQWSDQQACFFRWAGTHWQPCADKLPAEMLAAILRHVADGVDARTIDQKTSDSLQRYGTARGIAAMFAADPRSKMTTETDPPGLLACPRGVLDLNAGEWLAHDPSRPITRCCPIDPLMELPQ